MFQLIDTIIVTPIINILFLILHFVGDFGIAIILFTVFVKLITWPIIKKNFIQMNLMKKVQPELSKIKKECKGNRQLETLRTMELYRKYNIKPFRSIFNTIIQIPIFIALFTAVSVMVAPTPKDNVKVRAYPPISQLSVIKDISDKQQEYLKDVEHNKYHFHPKLFNLVDLSSRAGFKDLNQIIIFLPFIANIKTLERHITTIVDTINVFIFDIIKAISNTQSRFLSQI